MNVVAQMVGTGIGVGLVLWYQAHRFKRYKRDFEQHMKGQQDGTDA